MIRSTRTRAVAIAAAVAAAVGGVAVATVTSAQNTQETIDGCRLVDTREASQVGPRGGALGPGETLTVQATGDNGECTGIPADAESLDIQLTARFPSDDTFLTVYNADLGTRPLISHLNPRADISTSSNTTIVSLSAGGAFNIYNEAGEVDVIIDVLGVFSPGSDGSATSYEVAETPATFVGDTLGARYRAISTGGEVFVGVNDLGVGANRSEAETTWDDGLRPFAFSFDGASSLSTIVAETGQPPGATPVAYAPGSVCATPDQLQIAVLARNNNSTAAIEDLVVNGVPVGDFGPATADATDYLANVRTFTVSGDFSGEFSVTGMFDTTGFDAGSENNRIELTVGCSS